MMKYEPKFRDNGSPSARDEEKQDRRPSRRDLLAGAAAASLVSLTGCVGTSSRHDASYRAHAKNIRHSVCHWCFSLNPNPLSVEELAKHAKRLGIGSIELVAPQHFKLLDDFGLTCAIGTIDMSPNPPFVKGFNNPRYHERVLKATRDAIDACAVGGISQVISFSGYSAVDVDDPKSALMSREDGIKNCIAGYKKIVGYAEEKGITLSLEMLNTRDSSHPMKGHPGYQADDLDYVIEVIDGVGSPNLKLLFDVYHVQVMHGDVIRRLRQLKNYTSHYHVAGNPERGEIDDSQELSHPAIMTAIAETGYKGFVGQEWIPTWDDKIAALSHAIRICDV